MGQTAINMKRETNKSRGRERASDTFWCGNLRLLNMVLMRRYPDLDMSEDVEWLMVVPKDGSWQVTINYYKSADAVGYRRY